MNIPTLIIHGWSDTSGSFLPIARFLESQGHDVRKIFLADYISLHDEIKLEDLGTAMKQALLHHSLSLEPRSFNIVIHSTGALVVREFLRQHCVDDQGRPDVSLTPIRNLLMLAPANFGSPIAKKGKSMLGRLFKGTRRGLQFESGKRLLDALELASPISFDLALKDMFDSAFPVFKKEHTAVTVMVGSNCYKSRVKRLLHENGSDGTVRVSTANLNARYLIMRIQGNEAPKLEWVTRNCQDACFAVMDRDHGSVTKDLKSQQAEWRKIVLDSLSVTPATYDALRAYCEQVTRATFAAGQQSGRIETRERFHEYMHLVFRVRDQHGEPINDYYLEFYQDRGDERDLVMEHIHRNILEKVTVNSVDASCRSFLFDTTDLRQAFEKDSTLKVDMRLFAADLSDDITFDKIPATGNNPGVRVYDANTQAFFHPNCPMLVDVILYRRPSDKVFKISDMPQS